jgi:hypothetical protein
LLLHDKQADLDVQLLHHFPAAGRQSLVQPPLLSRNLEDCRIPQLPIRSPVV